jgi:hypothetical protein
MDLSGWMQTTPGGEPRRLAWINADTAEAATPEDAASWLRLERCLGAQDATELLGEWDVQGVYCLTLAGGQAVSGLEMWTPDMAEPREREDMLAAVRVVRTLPSNTPAGRPPLNFLSRDVTRRWIEAQVQPNLNKNGENAGETAIQLPLAGRAMLGLAPWTRDLPRLYAQRWDGEELRGLLPYLWFDGPGAERFRWRYRTLLAELFQDGFLTPATEWSQETNRLLTFQAPHSTTLLDQALDGWAPAMRLLAPAQTTAIHDPGSTFSSPLILKEAVSVSHQFEREPVLNEVFDGREGRQNPLVDFREFAERSLTLGALRLAGPDRPRSWRAVGKRLAGASDIRETQPWWPGWLDVAAGIERLEGLLYPSRRQVNVLVLSPSESILALAQTPLPPNLSGFLGKNKPNERVEEIEQAYRNLLQALLNFQIDYDLGDEDLIEKHGLADANTFWIGQGGEYTIVVVPPAHSWRRSTVKKLRKFARKGGCVLMARPIAPLIDFEPADGFFEKMADEFANVHLIERAGREVCFQLNRLDPRAFSIRAQGQDTSPLLVQHRKTPSHELFLVNNTSRSESLEARVQVSAPGAVRVLDPWVPQILLKDSDVERQSQSFNFNFHAAGATLFSVGGQADLTEPFHQRRPHTTSREMLEETWDFERLDPNLLPLKECRAYVAGEAYSANLGRGARLLPIEFIRAALTEELARKTTEGDGAFEPIAVSLTFEFESRVHPRRRNIRLILEPNPGLQVRVNGEAVAVEMTGFPASSENRDTEPAGTDEEGILTHQDVEEYGEEDFEETGDNRDQADRSNESDTSPEARPWLPDPAFLSLDIGSLLQQGPNTVEIAFLITEPFSATGETGPALEAPILAGDFGVTLDEKGQGILTEEPRTLRYGSWTEQGYPYYAGRMVYRQDFLFEAEHSKRYFLTLCPGWGAPGARGAAGAHIVARIGRHKPAPLTFAPQRLEITRLARNDINTLEIEIASTFYNLYGPVHVVDRLTRDPQAGPEIYDTLPANDRRLWNRVPQLVPFGLLGGAAIETYDPDAPPPPQPEKKPAKIASDAENPESGAETTSESSTNSEDIRPDSDSSSVSLSDENRFEDEEETDSEEESEEEDEFDDEDEEDDEEEDEDEEDEIDEEEHDPDSPE